jgi:hypothetical protein
VSVGTHSSALAKNDSDPFSFAETFRTAETASA